jgi:hypothetical protein
MASAATPRHTGLGVCLEVLYRGAPETLDFRGFSSAPERTRTSTDLTVHKALNLARLPIPPQARGAASIASRGAQSGVIAAAPAAADRFSGEIADARVVSVLGARYILEHMFEPARNPRQTELGADGWT